jgi:hypothetical protein
VILVSTLVDVILPVFLLIGAGVAVDRWLNPDLPTLARLNFYVFAPAILFVKVLRNDLAAGDLARIGSFAAAHILVMYALAWLVSSRGAWREHRPIMALCAMFTNSGNFGIPFVALAFGEAYLGAVAVILAVQNLLSFTLGIWILEREGRPPKEVLLGLLKVPMIHAIGLALVLRALELEPVPQIMQPMNYLAAGLIPLALVTLGVQLARSEMGGNLGVLGGVTGLRLLAGPAAATGLVWLFGFEGALAAVMIATAGLPVAVNVYIIAAEYDKDAGLASQAIFWTTLLSGLTLPALLWLVT